MKIIDIILVVVLLVAIILSAKEKTSVLYQLGKGYCIIKQEFIKGYLSYNKE